MCESARCDEQLNVFISKPPSNNRLYGADMDFLLRNKPTHAFDSMKLSHALHDEQAAAVDSSQGLHHAPGSRKADVMSVRRNR